MSYEDHHQKLERYGKTISYLAIESPRLAERLLVNLGRELEQLEGAAVASVSYRKLPNGSLTDIRIQICQHGYENE